MTIPTTEKISPNNPTTVVPGMNTSSTIISPRPIAKSEMMIIHIAIGVFEKRQTANVRIIFGIIYRLNVLRIWEVFKDDRVVCRIVIADVIVRGK
jgi:hypothetical protein